MWISNRTINTSVPQEFRCTQPITENTKHPYGSSGEVENRRGSGVPLPAHLSRSAHRHPGERNPSPRASPLNQHTSRHLQLQIQSAPKQPFSPASQYSYRCTPRKPRIRPMPKVTRYPTIIQVRFPYPISHHIIMSQLDSDSPTAFPIRQCG